MPLSSSRVYVCLVPSSSVNDAHVVSHVSQRLLVGMQRPVE